MDERPPCPECAPGDPDVDHVHATDYGYLVYAPSHDARDWLEGIRAAADLAGYVRGRASVAAGFFEPDEPVEQVREAFERGEKGLTAPPA